MPADFPFPVPDYRFDQRNEMFKRRIWDEEVRSYGNRFFTEARYQDKEGYRKLDYALRIAAWNVEYAFACGNYRSNHGMYSWTQVADRARPFVELGDPVSYTPERNAHIVKKAARFVGADLVGICHAHPNLVYSHEFDAIEMKHRPMELPHGCTHAIVMAVEMDYEAYRQSPDAIAGAATGLGYSRQAVVANLVAAFIRVLGFRAVPSGNDTALSIPLALAAGLGEAGRHGLLITEKFGPRVRLSKVFTDLPLAHDDYRPFGAARFCRTCRKCATRCPSQAIPHGDPTTEGPTSSNHSGVLKWYVNSEKCYQFWSRNWMDCANCISVCPFNKRPGRLHDAVRFVVRRTPAFNRLMVRLDDLCGYGKPLPTQQKRFWESG